MTDLKLAKYIQYRKELSDIALNDNSFDDDVLIAKEIETYLEYKRNPPQRKKAIGGFGMASLGLHLMNETETKFFELIIERASKS